MYKYWLIVLLVFSGLNTTVSAQEMNNIQLERVFKIVSDTVIGTAGRWEIWVGETPLLCLTDEFHNRMRIISPIKKVEEAGKEEILKCMEANFHTALDVKYAISDDVIWAAFIHPLKELTDEQVVDAMAQVYAAVLTYGTSYTSTNLTFPKQEEREKEINKKKDKSRS